MDRLGLWKEVELCERTGKVLDPVFSANTLGSMTPIITYTMLDDCVGLVVASVLKCKLYKADGTEFERKDNGLICSKKPQETLRRELVGWEYSSRLDPSFVEQGNSDILEALVIRFAKDGYFWTPKTELIFQIKSDILFDTTPHANTRFSFRIYLFGESYSTFTDLRTKGLLGIPEGLGDPPLGIPILRQGEIDSERELKRDYRDRV